MPDDVNGLAVLAQPLNRVRFVFALDRQTAFDQLADLAFAIFTRRGTVAYK